MRSALYLIEIPHQTTTFSGCRRVNASCILSKFHIKPQLLRSRNAKTRVVSYRNSTSNHNCRSFIVCSRVVVSYRNSTSNHNVRRRSQEHRKLYLIEIPHQTTTSLRALPMLPGCILSKFHIKPQHGLDVNLHNSGCILSKFHIKPQLLMPSKYESRCCILSKFHIKPQLLRSTPRAIAGCILSKFHIKPQLCFVSSTNV